MMSPRLASLVISEGKLWLGGRGTSGRGGISLLLVFWILIYAKFRDDSDILRKHIRHWGSWQIGQFKKDFPILVFSHNGYQI